MNAKKIEISYDKLVEWVYKCTGCSSCQSLYRTQWPKQTYDPACPIIYAREYEYGSPGGLMWLIRGSLEGITEWNMKTLETLYSCATCKSCEFQCYSDHGEHITDIIIAAREKLVEDGKTLPKIRDFLNAIQKYGNPWGETRNKRMSWVTHIPGVRKYKPNDEFLYYVGCVGSYDPVGQRMAKSLAELLVEAGVSFGVLGDEENCCGNEVKTVGETGLFEMLREYNINKFKQLEVKKIITLSPHSYHTFRNEYSNFEVVHFTELLLKLIQEGKLKVSAYKAKVTYHDSCFLGRYNNVYDEPREILKLIPGIELVEMRRNRENSLCCGGGGGNFFTGLLNARARVKEAYETGAEIIAVACPICEVMLEDSLKEENLEGKMSVMGIPEIVKGALAKT